MNKFQTLCLLICIIGSIYLGVNALFNFDILKIIFKTNTTIINVIHILFGFCGIVSLIQLKK